jgi:hypothetical protein
MSRSDQLGLCCTLEPNYSGLSARLTGTSKTSDCALDTCEPSCVPKAARPFLYFCGPQPAGGCGEVRPGPRGSAGAHLSRVARSRAENTWQRRSSPLGEAEPRSMGHVAAPKPTLEGRRGPELRNTWQRRSSTW